tara:strand:+ start:9600 stop:9992 length:393 start_codon:yes stop_codon:yes gene_type:complete
MSHQDWDQVVFKKRLPRSIVESKSRGVKISKERANTKNEAFKNTLNMRKVDNEEIEIKKVGFNLSKLIQKARFDSKLSQKALADKLNIQVSVIQKYESGKIIPNKTFLYKMGKIVNVHLTGKNIGKVIKE